MNLASPDLLLPSAVDGTELTALQLRVARRADELARLGTSSRAGDRQLWLRAELEVLECAERARPRWLHLVPTPARAGSVAREHRLAAVATAD